MAFNREEDFHRMIGAQEVEREKREMAKASDSGIGKAISDSTPVKLGFVILVVSGVIGAVFWAATLQADVRNIREILVEMVKDHETRIRALEKGK